MKTYQSHKTVQAAKIVRTDEDKPNFGLNLTLEDGSKEFVGYADSGKFRFDYGDLGYFVRYEDGYISWSPTKAFEEGYSEVEPLHDVPAP